MKRALGPAAMAAWVVLIGLITIPVAIFRPDVGLDSSWRDGLIVASAHRLQFGTDVVWTYGPYGFLDATDYHLFGHWLAAAAVTVALHFVLLGLVALWLYASRARLWLWLVLGATWLLPFFAFPTMEYDALLSAVLLMHVSSTSRRPAMWTWAAGAAGSLLGFLLTVKGTALLASLALLGVYAVLNLPLGRWRQVTILAAGALAGFGVLWLAAGQRPDGIPVYFSTSYEVDSGYSAGASLFLHVPVEHRTSQLLLALGLGGLAAAGAARAAWRRERSLLSLSLLSLPVLGIFFKESYVRFGNRQMVFFAMAAVLSALLLVEAARHLPGRERVLAMGQPALTLGVCAVFLAGAYSWQMSLSPPPWFTGDLGLRLHSYAEAARVVVDAADRARLEAGLTDEAQAHFKLSPEELARLRQGSVDVYPWDLVILRAYRLNWSPRPVLQSYLGYTSALDHVDARHFRGAGAPDRILYYFMPGLDGRYLLFDEPETTRAILAGYQVESAAADHAVLVRRPAALDMAREPVGRTTAPLDSWVKVPSAGLDLVFADLDVGYSLSGRIRDLAFQPAELHFEFQLADGSVTPPYRYIPAVGPDGVLVSPHVATQDGFAGLLQGRPGRGVTAIRVSSDRPSDYRPELTVGFYRSAALPRA